MVRFKTRIFAKFQTINKLSSITALKIFLNAETGLCRPLLMQFLSALWAIQSWARAQTSLRLYSSSLLLAYDARCLKNSLMFRRCKNNQSTNNSNGSISPQMTDVKIKPIFPWSDTAEENETGESIQLYKKIQRTHSFQNNFDEVSRR